MLKQELLEKHYRVMLCALNEIKEIIATDPCTWLAGTTTDDYENMLRKIDNVAGSASTINLFNPHNHPGDAEEYIGKMVDPWA